MSKFMTTLTLSFFLLFQTTSFAQEVLDMERGTITNEVPDDMPLEDPREQITEVAQEQEEATEGAIQEPEISEDQKEAAAAEEAELREVGVGDEPESE